VIDPEKDARAAALAALEHAYAPYSGFRVGAALVGDAADFYDPITGEGIHTALRGGELLAANLLDELADFNGNAHCGLRAYESARRREFGGKWKIERLLGLSLVSTGAMNRIARVLAANKDMADLFVGVAGDFIPASAVLNPRYFLKLAFGRGARA